MAYIRHEDKIIKIVDNYPISDIEEKIDIQMEIRKVYKKAHILDMTTTTFQGMSADEVYRKAKAWEELKKYIDEEVDNYMTLYRETKDPAYSLLNSHYDTLLGYMEELERADDDR